MTRPAALGAAWLAALLALGCAPPIRTQVPPLESRPVVHSVLVQALEADTLKGAGVPDDAGTVVTNHVVAALQSETKLRVVAEGESDAVMSGVILRYSEREGTASGVKRPASVWFELQLRDREGAVLWSGAYEETQAALSDDVGSLPRAWERGFRWVTAEELADYGARMLARDLQREIDTWS
ncbi:MAG TPA: LPS assembly lipoprotein LptE [Myxococcota bacterium]|nr:LPS assembly lipoprotein LptE [Myxococcota bacterium]